MFLQHDIDNNKTTETIVLFNTIEHMQHLSHEITNFTSKKQVQNWRIIIL